MKLSKQFCFYLLKNSCNLMKRYLSIVALIIVIINTSCSSARNENDYVLGKIMPLQICKSDTSVSYALFLPTNYNAEKSWPLVICLDSHGNGEFALTHFLKDAERLGYVITGSNNSKNGQSLEQNISYFRIMFNDLKERINIDPKRVYVCGFSGGARVASAIGLYEGGIQGVIGCGAGFPGINRQPSHNFQYLGVAGNADFNLTELKSLMKSLDGSTFPHHLLVFDGIHAWPEEKSSEDIFNWMEIKAMKDDLIPKRAEFVKGLESDFSARIDKYLENKDFYRAWLTCQTALHYLESFDVADPLRTKSNELAKMPELRKYLESLDQLAVVEEKLKQEYSTYFQSKNIDWWNNELARIRKFIDSKKDPDKVLMYKRILSYLSLVAYMNCSNALKSGNNELAIHFIDLYALIDPENPEHAKMRKQIGKPLNK